MTKYAPIAFPKKMQFDKRLSANEAFEIWLSTIMPLCNSMSKRERVISKSAFICAWEARNLHYNISCNKTELVA